MKQPETPPVTIAVGPDCVVKYFPDLKEVCVIVIPKSIQYLRGGL